MGLWSLAEGGMLNKAMRPSVGGCSDGNKKRLVDGGYWLPLGDNLRKKKCEL